ncbi:hypothetical protein F4814DRAFT_452277 [Daldinia grandis]|nr:hypothetical protein F4814DRAFT_452277 [Daldinia grandis]
MASNECTDDIYISSQEDINNLNCSCGGIDTNINILNAVGELSFPNCSSANTIYINYSPSLFELSIPDLISLQVLLVRDATQLSNILFPSLMSTGVSFDLLGAPYLGNITFRNISSFISLSLASELSDPRTFSDVTSVTNLVVGGYNDFGSLRSVEALQIIRPQSYRHVKMFENITSLKNLTFTNAPGDKYFGDSLLVNNTLTIEECSNQYDSFMDEFGDLAQIDSIGSYLQANDNSFTMLEFPQLETVNGDISFYNNTNCSFNFDKLSEIATLSIVDNINSTIPWFPQLQRASNIHIRGNIDTSSGRNIFPVLTVVSGNVTIEPWNDDFNCSKLVDQYQNDLIHNLVCNGTNNLTGASTENLTTNLDNSSSNLSQGAWAGIGVGIGVFVIGIVLGMVWLLLRLKRWKKEIIERIRQQEVQQDHRQDSLEMDYEPPTQNILLESDGTGVIREKPDDHLREAGGRAIIAEHPDDHRRELPVPPAELEGAPYMQRRI